MRYNSPEGKDVFSWLSLIGPSAIIVVVVIWPKNKHFSENCTFLVYKSGFARLTLYL
jgi:hypothetical protein